MKNTIRVLLAFGMMLASASSFAGDTSKGLDVGVLAGYGSIGSATYNPNGFTIGGRADYSFDMASAGLEYTWMSTTPSGALSGVSANLSTAVLNIDYRFNGLLYGLFIGPKVGLGMTTATGVNSNNTFLIGGEAGYDLHIQDFSIGPQLNYMSISGANGSPNFTLFQALAALKYWF